MNSCKKIVIKCKVEPVRYTKKAILHINLTHFPNFWRLGYFFQKIGFATAHRYDINMPIDMTELVFKIPFMTKKKNDKLHHRLKQGCSENSKFSSFL